MGYVPCFMLYSAFGPEHAYSYSLSFFAFIVIALYLCLNEWVLFDRREKRIKINND